MLSDDVTKNPGVTMYRLLDCVFCMFGRKHTFLSRVWRDTKALIFAPKGILCSSRASKIRYASVRSSVLSCSSCPVLSCPSRFFLHHFWDLEICKTARKYTKIWSKKGSKRGQIQEMSDFGILKMQNCLEGSKIGEIRIWRICHRFSS